MSDKTPDSTAGSDAAAAQDGPQTFNQADLFDAANRPPPPAPGKRIKHALMAALAMLAIVLGGLVVGLGGGLSILLGIAAFIGILAMAKDELALSSALSVAGEPRRPNQTRRNRLRRVLRAPGVDVPALQADLDEAEAELRAIDAIADGLDRPALTAKLDAMTERARVVLDEIAREGAEAHRARKFFKVIIPSAKRSVEKFAALGVKDAELDDRMGALADDLTDAAQRQFETLRLDDKIDLEVEMEVLADRLRAGA